MERLKGKETPVYQASCQMCNFTAEGSKTSVSVQGSSHYVRMYRETGEIHQIWMGLKGTKPEWVT